MADSVDYTIEKIIGPLYGGKPAPGFELKFEQIIVGCEKTTEIEAQVRIRNPGTGEETRFLLD